MSKPVIITADSSADLPKHICEEFAIHFMPIYIQVEDRIGKDCIDIFPKDIWDAFRERGTIPKTAAPSIGEYKEFFERFTGEGAAVVHISLNAKFSSCHRIACMAAEEAEGEVYVVDSKSFCLGSGMLCVQAAKLRDQGVEAKPLAEKLCELRGKVRAYFILDELTFISKSGRCPAVLAMGASLLSLHPSVMMDGNKGEVVFGKRYRGKNAVACENWLHDAIEKTLTNCDRSMVFFFHTPEMPPEQYQPMERIASEGFRDFERLIMDTVGCTIISHVGGGCYAVVAMEK